MNGLTTWQKIVVGCFAAVAWAAAIVGKHFWPDLDIGMFSGACLGVLTTIGAVHMAGGSDPVPAVPAVPAAPAAPAQLVGFSQDGFVAWSMLWLVMPLALGAALLTGCAGLNVSWVATATYNTPATTAATLTPGLILPQLQAASAPAPAASGAKP